MPSPGEAQIFFCFVIFVQFFLLLREKNHQVARTGTLRASWDECRDVG